MANLKRTVNILLLCLSSVAFITCKKCDVNVMTDAEFAMCIIGESFVITTSSTGAQSTPFGELRIENMTANLIAYQRLHSIPVTGVMDSDTKTEMMKPTCGVRDYRFKTQMTRRKRFAVGNSKWDNSSPLSYRYINYTPDLPVAVTRRVIAASFKMWSDVTNLEFREVPSNTAASAVDIEILFQAREHGDGPAAAFDGQGGTLAHAYFPSRSLIGGDAHFDEDELYTDLETRGINLFQVAVHEFGHSLGLEHSSVRQAIMFPSYNGYVPNFTLDRDDIRGIQTLYGVKTQTTTPPTTTTTTTTTTTRATTTTRRQTPVPTAGQTNPPAPTTTTTTTTAPTTSGDRTGFCQSGYFDAISSFRGVTYVFKGDLYAVLTPSGIAPGYPQPISSKFAGPGGNIDAVLSWEDHPVPRLYIFKGAQYWRYDSNLNLRSGYPRRISNGFPGLPNDIDSAFVWGGNGRTYVFKNGVYYRLQGEGSGTVGTVSSGYPRSQNIWGVSNVIGDITAVFTWPVNSRTYMFRNNEYIRFNDYSLGVDQSASPRYPRPSADWWLRCDRGSLEVGQSTSHPAEMEDSADMKKPFDIIPQADDNDKFVIGGATVPRQGALLSVVILVTINFWFNC